MQIIYLEEIALWHKNQITGTSILSFSTLDDFSRNMDSSPIITNSWRSMDSLSKILSNSATSIKWPLTPLAAPHIWNFHLLIGRNTVGCWPSIENFIPATSKQSKFLLFPEALIRRLNLHKTSDFFTNTDLYLNLKHLPVSDTPHSSHSVCLYTDLNILSTSLLG